MWPDDAATVAALQALIARAIPVDGDVDDAEDRRQEAITRVLAAGDRIDERSLAGYAWFVARSLRRAEERAVPFDPKAPPASVEQLAPAPDESADLLTSKERGRLRAALAQLSPADRAVLDLRDVQGAATDEAAARLDVTPGTLRVRLLRARARLRVRVVLLERGVEADERCVLVLGAIAAGDAAAQRRLDAEAHVPTCPVCDEVADDVRGRRTPVPILGVVAGWSWLRRSASRRPGPTAGAAVAAAGALAVGGFVLAGDDGSAPVASPATSSTTLVAPPTSSPPAQAPLRTADGRPLLPVPASLADLADTTVVGVGLTVLEVVGDEAFWVGPSPDQRVLVVLVTGPESLVDVVAGQQVDFIGVLVAHGADFPATVGVGDEEASALLVSQAAHISVEEVDLDLRPG